jgi:hypothetical protein
MRVNVRTLGALAVLVALGVLTDASVALALLGLAALAAIDQRIDVPTRPGTGRC